MKQSLLNSCVSLAVLGMATLAAPAFAEDAKPADKAADDTLNAIVVTAVRGGQTKINTSVSISSLSAEQISNINPSSDVELLRSLPGIQVPGTGGPGGNANINIRGLQTLSGGSPFLQLQEDGLPVVLTGDMAFANNDFFTHVSPIIENVEAIRGGSASTLASQAVGGVINYISKTGRGDGGYVELEKGVNYDYTKVKGLVSGSINDSTYYNIGGYFDIGRGPRHAAWNVSDSYEIKGNVTKEFDGNKGYIRLLFKVADTQEPFYNSGLVTANVSGNSISGFSAVPGFDYRNQAGTYSILNRNWTIVNYDGTNSSQANTQTVANNGIVTHQKLFQLQMHYNVSDNVTVSDNGRVGIVSGSFAAGFYGSAPTAGVTSTAGGATIGSFIYANGVNAGKVYTGALVDNSVDIYTRMRDLNSMVNDLAISAKFNMGDDIKANLKGGWFYDDQHAGLDWHANNTYSDGVNGVNPAMLDPVSGANGAGNLLAINGQAGYNNNWGNGNAQTYDLDYSINAPYADLTADYGKLSLDASIREELYHYSGTQSYGGTGSTGMLTVNQVDPRNGAIVATTVPYAYTNTTSYYNFNSSATNWSVGLLYKFDPSLTAFVRAAHGTRFAADRLAFGPNSNGDGSLNPAGAAQLKYPVDQYEIGLKNRGELLGGHYTIEATLYHSIYSISSFGVIHNCDSIVGAANVTSSTTCTLTEKFHDTGYEIFATYGLGKFNLMANLTGDFSKYLSAGATTWQKSPLAHLAYTVSASYRPMDNSSIGVAATGNTSTYDAGNGFTYPGSVIFTAFGKIGLTKNLQAGIEVYNLFNAIAIQGGQPGAVNGNQYAATIADGRSVKGSIKFSF